MNPLPRKILVGIVVFITVSSIGTYAYIKALPYLTGPIIEIIEPANGSRLADRLVTIDGVAVRVSKLTLNDRAIFTDETGRFSEQLLLPDGYAIMTLEGIDRFNRVQKKVLEFVY